MWRNALLCGARSVSAMINNVLVTLPDAIWNIPNEE
jgi:hypothetical protein